MQSVTAQEKVTFTMIMPQQIDAGESFTVELTINKYDISGDARFIQRFPEGFTVEEIPDKNAGAQFEWKPANQQLFFRWDSVHPLPDAPVINMAYRVVTAQNCQPGETQINGRLIYIDNQGELVREEMISPVFDIIGAGGNNVVEENKVQVAPPQAPPIAKPKPTINNNGNKIKDEDIDAPVISVPKASLAQNNNVYVIRQTPYIDENIYRVNLLIIKRGLDGYGCLEENISPATQIEATETKGAKMEITDNKIRFTWTKLPKSDSVPISYKITSIHFADMKTKPEIFINGKFSFVSDGVKDSVDIVERDITISQWLPVPDATLTDISLNALISGGGTTLSSPSSSHCNVSRGKPGRGLVFKIQVLAARRALSDDEICEKLKQKGIELKEVITEDVVRHPGEEFPYKYAIGNFRSYEQACIWRDNMQRRFGRDNSGRPNAFLVCYYNGDRITVQEALLIESRRR
ncbi:hypothetical protein FACS189452_00230 [Bacteroidia bacterium]|nr:hypothetical protein FACS189452_00230 [Bacteroidia bacterium]GHT80320.1 hypothetical protein FACS189467_2200 [Bacteroidia bacterium]